MLGQFSTATQAQRMTIGTSVNAMLPFAFLVLFTSIVCASDYGSSSTLYGDGHQGLINSCCGEAICHSRSDVLGCTPPAVTEWHQSRLSSRPRLAYASGVAVGAVQPPGADAVIQGFNMQHLLSEHLQQCPVIKASKLQDNLGLQGHSLAQEVAADPRVAEQQQQREMAPSTIDQELHELKLELELQPMLVKKIQHRPYELARRSLETAVQCFMGLCSGVLGQQTPDSCAQQAQAWMEWVASLDLVADLVVPLLLAVGSCTVITVLVMVFEHIMSDGRAPQALRKRPRTHLKPFVAAKQQHSAARTRLRTWSSYIWKRVCAAGRMVVGLGLHIVIAAVKRYATAWILLSPFWLSGSDIHPRWFVAALLYGYPLGAYTSSFFTMYLFVNLLYWLTHFLVVVYDSDILAICALISRWCMLSFLLPGLPGLALLTVGRSIWPFGGPYSLTEFGGWLNSLRFTSAKRHWQRQQESTATQAQPRSLFGLWTTQPRPSGIGVSPPGQLRPVRSKQQQKQQAPRRGGYTSPRNVGGARSDTVTPSSTGDICRDSSSRAVQNHSVTGYLTLVAVTVFGMCHKLTAWMQACIKNMLSVPLSLWFLIVAACQAVQKAVWCIQTGLVNIIRATLHRVGTAFVAAAGQPTAGLEAGSAAAAAAASPIDESDAKLCVICLDAPRTHSVVHAQSDDSRLCLCLECSRSLNRSHGFPVCRQVVSRIVNCFDC